MRGQEAGVDLGFEIGGSDRESAQSAQILLDDHTPFNQKPPNFNRRWVGHVGK